MKHLFFVLIAATALLFAFLHYPSKTVNESAIELKGPLQDLMGINNAVILETDIIGSGKPGAADLSMAAQAGVKSVIDLRTAQEGLSEEQTFTKKYGLRYFNIPVTYDTLDEGEVQRLREILSDPANRPALLHCQSGGRVKKLWDLYKKG